MTRNLSDVASLGVLLALSSILVVGCDRHAGAPPEGDQAAKGPEPQSMTVFTEKVELFMEYPALVQGEPAKFVSHFTVLATGEPVRSGTLTFERTGDNGKTVTFRADQPARDGLFTPTHAFDAPGKYKARYVLDSPQVRETVDMGEFVVHANTAAALAASEGQPEPEPPGAVQFLMEQQWKISMLLDKVQKRTLVERIHAAGRIAPMQTASAIVSAPVSGRLLPPESATLPPVGTEVKRGDVLGFIEPALPATEAAALSANRAQVHSLETELILRGMELDIRGLEVERSLHQAKARLDFGTRAFQRAEELKSKGVGSDQQHDEARQNLELAQAESESAIGMKRQFESAAQKLTDLRSRVTDARDGKDTPLALQLPLRAPIDGRIVESEHVEGEQIDALKEVFHIVNLDRVWIIAQVSEFDLARLPQTPGAVFTVPAVPDRRFEVLEAGGRLLHIGTMVDPRTRTVQVRYEIPNPDGIFRGDMLADVYLESRRATERLAVTEDAVVMDNGKFVVFALLEGEKYQKREVDLGIRDAGFVEIKSGLSEGERVATRGAYAVNLASQSPASFGHGHVH